MRIYNTLTRQKEEFKPIVPNEVKMYSCGPTVYNYFHIGNARPFIIFDTMRRYLEYNGYKVKFVQNFTDVDDKMINRAKDENISVKELADRFIAEYFTDSKGLGIKEASVHPKATENIDAIIDIIKKLEENGYAYNVDGDVYFSTKKFAGYGKLSKQPLEDLEAGARIDLNEQKRDVMDFSLWKNRKTDEEIAWESPWGMGRPGWHIECSAMANKFLGETIDIHSGGQDLIFPHHENEIAQSEAANGKPFANYWIHNGYININNQKMSKSLNNFFTVRDVAEKYDYEIIRFFMLSAHYRNPVNFSEELMEQSKSALDRIYTCLENLNFVLGNSSDENSSDTENELLSKLDEHKKAFLSAMDDDLNTADAIAAIFDLVKAINVTFTTSQKASRKAVEASKKLLIELCDVLGLLTHKDENNGLDLEIESLVAQRQEARANKNWAEADAIRDKLKEIGITIEDTPMGIKVVRN